MKKTTRQTARLQRRKRPTEEGTPVVVRLQAEQLKQLDDWRRKQLDLPTRPEAIRRLLASALEGR
jgi:hypothetical protein